MIADDMMSFIKSDLIIFGLGSSIFYNSTMVYI